MLWLSPSPPLERIRRWHPLNRGLYYSGRIHLAGLLLNGKGEMKRLKLDKSVVDPEDVEVIEDLIMAAFNDAKLKVEQHVADETQKLMGGMKLPPGLKLPF